MIKLITIDLDNTLWDSEPVIRKAEKNLAGWLASRLPQVLALLREKDFVQFKAALIAEEQSLRYRVSAMRKKALKTLMLEAGLAEDEAAEQSEAAFHVFWHARQQVRLYDNALPLLQALSHRYPLVSITNGNADLKTIGLHHYFNHMVSADDVGIGKPEPEIFLHALALAGVQPDEAVHIGDHLTDDVAGAKAVGMHAIWYNPEAQPAEDESGHEVRSLDDVPALIEALHQSRG